MMPARVFRRMRNVDEVGSVRGRVSGMTGQVSRCCILLAKIRKKYGC
jgi:hypothetical protein